MLAAGPFMRRFEESSKVVFHNSDARHMRLILPVVPGTVLDEDCTEIGYISFRDKENRQDAPVRRVKPKIDVDDPSHPLPPPQPIEWQARGAHHTHSLMP